MDKYKSAFIAFSGDGEDKANAAFKALQRLGLPTRAIYHYQFSRQKISEDVGANIRGEIRDKDALILIYSANARSSEWVQHELSVASGLEKPVLLLKSAHNIKVELHDSVKDYAHLTEVPSIKKLSTHFLGTQAKVSGRDIRSLNHFDVLAERLSTFLEDRGVALESSVDEIKQAIDGDDSFSIIGERELASIIATMQRS
ncbi:MAG: TIR domain-containing protein [Paracoccaceae bacterium]